MRKSGASHGAGKVPPRAGRQLLAWLCRHAVHPASGGHLPHVPVHALELLHHHADERQGHHAVAAEPPAVAAHRASRARALQEGVARGQPLCPASDPDRQGQRERAADRTARRSERQDRGRRGQDQRALRPARPAEADHQRGAGQGRDPQSAARGPQASARGLAGSARRLRGQGPREPGQDRRSRAAAERGARQEGSGARPLPL